MSLRRSRRLLLILPPLLAACGLGLASPAARADAAAGPCGTTAAPPKTYQHVVWIWMENHSFSSVIGPAPYLTSLAENCGLSTNYHALGHPSLPNYLAATSGKLTDAQDCQPTDCPVSGASLFQQVTDSGGTWRSYQESMPTNCALTDSGPYIAHHNPAAYYTDLRGACPADDVPLGTLDQGAFQKDIDAGTLPTFAFVTPNECNDMHSSCNGSDAVHQGDSWLSSWMTKLTTSPAYLQGDTAVFITFDEADGDTGNTNQVATVVVAPSVAPGITIDKEFNHFSLLRATDYMLGLPPLGSASDPTIGGMRPRFNL